MNQSRKMSQWWGGLFSLIALVMAFAATSANANFCLRDTYGRGVGKVPAACADADRAMDEGLCYKKCPAGYDGRATFCVKDCPAGMKDDGALTCNKPAAPAPYGVGAGYPWKIGDRVGNYDQAGERCRAANGAGCTRDGLIWYPNCKAGFYKTGALICSPNEIKCPEGFKDWGVSCERPQTERGVGTIPNSCGSGKQLDAGLCYDNCKPNFAGVGPVCGQQCTGATPVSCGVVGCAASQKDCSASVMSPIISVFMVYGAAIATPVAISIESGKILVERVKAAARAAKYELGGLTLEQVLTEQGANAGVRFTSKQLMELTKALNGQDFDPIEIDGKQIAAVVKAYSKPQVCKS